MKRLSAVSAKGMDLQEGSFSRVCTLEMEMTLQMETDGKGNAMQLRAGNVRPGSVCEEIGTNQLGLGGPQPGLDVPDITEKLQVSRSFGSDTWTV